MATSPAGIDALLTCFICLCRAVEPRICPSCSKICCAECILKWLTENRSNCPHCRSPLSSHSLVNGRFVSEISDVIDKLASKTAASDVCETHAAPLSYFCATCVLLVCSDCAMFEPTHKGHKFERLSSVYDRRAEELKAEGTALEMKIAELKRILTRINCNIEDVKKNKEAVEADFEVKIKEIRSKIDSELFQKAERLNKDKVAVAQKLAMLTEMQTEVERLVTGPKTKLLAAAHRLKEAIRECAAEETPKFDPVSAEFECDVKPQYSSSTFLLHDYSRSSTEVVYSDTLQVQREAWRLKVYPYGNGAARNTYLSVFLELLKGGYGSICYDYRIELLNHRDPSLRLIREFSSEFDQGECWGYNRFLQLDKLLSDGYLDPADDRLTFKFYIRPASYAELCRRQALYIETLEKENREMAGKRMELRTHLTAMAPPAVSASSENPIVSPAPQKSVERLSWPEDDCDLLPSGEIGGEVLLGFPVSPESSSPEPLPQWTGENDGFIGNDPTGRSVWLEKRFRGLMDSPMSSVPPLSP